MTAEQFKQSLSDLEASPQRFAKYVGANDRTVRRWASGEQDIPSWVPVMLDLIRNTVDHRGGKSFALWLKAAAGARDALSDWVRDAKPSRATVLGEIRALTEILDSIAPPSEAIHA